MSFQRVMQETTEEFKELLEAQDVKFNELTNRLDGLEAASKRIGAPAPQTKGGNPQMERFLKMGEIPESKDFSELSVTNNGQGVTVRGEWANLIFEKVFETSPMRAIAGVLSTESNVLEVLVDRDEPDSEWVAELGDRDPTDASFMTRQPIEVHEHYAYPAITLQMLEDSQFNVQDWLQYKLALRFARQEAAAFIHGDGDGKPRGILDYDIVPEASFTWGKDPNKYEIGAQYSGTDGDIDNADCLIDLVDSLKAAYLPGASWLMTRAFRNKLRKLKDSNDRYLYMASLDSNTPDRLLGYPVYLAEDMPTPQAGVVGALFGDFSEAYSIVDRTGITVQRDAVTKPGWVKYYARRRTGGAVTNPEAVKALVLGSASAE